MATNAIGKRRSHQSEDVKALNNGLFTFPALNQDQDSESANRPLHALLEGDGPSMFDENRLIDAGNPLALSATSPGDLQTIIDYHGAAELIRRLSTALAQRDAHVTALIRLAEEFKIPNQRITDTASRVKQAEERRLSLAAASEDLGPPSAIGSDSGVGILMYSYGEHLG